MKIIILGAGQVGTSMGEILSREDNDVTLVQVRKLVSAFRARALGSRLTLRFIATFAILALVPLAMVYYFSVQFLSRSIDSWFDVRIEKALDDALLLGRSTLEATKLEVIRQARTAARQ